MYLIEANLSFLSIQSGSDDVEALQRKLEAISAKNPNEPDFEGYIRQFADRWEWDFVRTLPQNLFQYLMRKTASHFFFMDQAPGEADVENGLDVPYGVEMMRMGKLMLLFVSLEHYKCLHLCIWMFIFSFLYHVQYLNHDDQHITDP